jgi:hypothetical protein
MSLMCRNIKTLHHFIPPATEDEMRASALQYVRKLSGMQKPPRHNQAVFDQAVEEIYQATTRLLGSLVSHGAPRTRELEQERAAARGKKRDERMRAKLIASLKQETA